MNSMLSDQAATIATLQKTVKQLTAEVARIDSESISNRNIESLDRQLKLIQDDMNRNPDTAQMKASIERLTMMHREQKQELESNIQTLREETSAIPQKLLHEVERRFSSIEEMSEKAAIVDVNESLQHKANKETIDLCLQRKVNREEINELELRIMATQKNTIATTVQNTLLNYLTKKQYGSFDSIPSQQQEDGSVDIAALISSLQSSSEPIASKELKYSIDQRVELIKQEFSTLIKRESLKTEDSLRHAISDLQTQLRQKAMASDVQLMLASKIDRQEVLDALKQKSSIPDVQRMLQKNTDAVALEVQQIVSSLKQEIVNVVNKKAYKSDVTRSLQGKASIEEVTKWLGEKANVSDLREACLQAVEASSKTISQFHKQTEIEIDELRHEINQKISSDHATKELVSLRQEVVDLHGWKPAFEELRKDVVLKVGIKDACTLLDMKSNITDVNEALDEIHSNLAQKSEGFEINQIKGEMETLKQQIRGEVCIGRWIWKSGRPSDTQTIVWNVQAVNSSPDVFIWERNADVVTTVIPGLYQICATFFTDRAPTVQVLVNGEPTLIICESANAKLKAIRRARHSAGSVTGITISDFLALPARSQISISYNIDEKAQGFLSLRKL